MMDTVLQQLIEYVRDMSPLIWSAVVRQVYIDATISAVWSMIISFACVGLWMFSNYSERVASREDCYDEENWIAVKWVARVICCVLVFIALGLLIDFFGKVANPDYHAILLIIYNLK